MEEIGSVRNVLKTLLDTTSEDASVDNAPQFIIDELIKMYPEHTLNTRVERVGNKSKIFKFVLTGGPCGGKTTAMARLQGYLKERGFRVFIVPEAATMLLLNGATFDDFSNPRCPMAFQEYVIRTQISLEDSTENYARATGEDSVILCDRGTMDGLAYMNEENFEILLGEVGMDIVTARDMRYNAVFHLVTAADGACDFYSLANNAARSESIQEAIDLDIKTQKAWAGHPHHFIIGNYGFTFDQKIQQLVSRLAQFIGLPSVSKDQTHKYSLKSLPDLSGVQTQEFIIEKIMLKNDEKNAHLTSSSPMSGLRKREEGNYPLLYRFIRKRSQGSMHAYGITSVYQHPNGQEVELKQIIDRRVYRQMLSLADPERSKIIQRRSYFLYEKQSFYVNEFLSPASEKGRAFIICQSENTPMLPPFVKIDHMIRGPDRSHNSSRSLSKLSDDSPSNSDSLDRQQCKDSVN